MGAKKNKKTLAKQSALARKKSSTKGNSTKSDQKKSWLILSLILLFTFLCFSPNLNNGFVNWDDGKNIVENELITGLNNDNFWELSIQIFKTDIIGGYNPLSIWTFLLENKFIGIDKPEYWHLNNIILHLICCFFTFWIGLRMRLGLLGTSLLTLLFAIHPMRVESVAWITERKDVLFGAFYLASLFYYIKGKQDGFRKRDILIITICFLLSLLSKIQAVVLPISLILVDYYFSKSKSIKLSYVINKWPYFLASLTIGCLGVFLLKSEGSTELSYTGLSRVFIGSYSLFIYYIKSIIPFRMSPLYPYPNYLDWHFYVSILSFIASAYLLWFCYIKKWSTIFWGLSFFLANVVLMLQILGAGHGFLADRFTYIPYLGLFFIYSFYLEKLYNSNKKYRILVMGISGIAILVYSLMCFNQNKIWKNSDTLWTHVLKYYSDADTPWANRAIYYRDKGMVKKALFDFSQYIKLEPNKSDAYNSKARLYFNYSERDSLIKALENFNKAIEIKSDDPEYLVNRGATYAKLGENENALKDFNQAEKKDPEYPNVYLNRSLLYNSSEDWNNALLDLEKYLTMKPYNPKLWIEKARLHMILKQFDPWWESSNKAISMESKNGLYHYERARGWYYFKKYDEAKASLKKALSLGYTRGNQSLIDKILESN